MPDDAETNGREALLATALSEDGAIGQGRRRTSTSSLSEGFNREGSSRWDQTGTTGEGVRDNNFDDNDDDDGSEHELLLNSHQQTQAQHHPPSARRGHPSESMEMVDITTDDDSTKVPVVRFDEDVEQENSPYPEVRAAVRNYDEDLPCNTVRAWAIGMSLIFLGASMNTVFSLRSPSISLGPLIAQVIAWPIGHGWARVMPTKQFNTFGLRWSLNPGPFNIKEHAIIVVMASVSFSVAYATDIILAQLVFYKQDFGLVFQLLLTISTQSLGYGIAGMMRRFLGKLQGNPTCLFLCTDLPVYPAAMIWPGNLVGVTLMNAMYEKNEMKNIKVFGGSMPRYRWFAIITLVSGIYYFIPGFLAQFLSSFAFVTWFAPKSPVINQLFGMTTGLSLIPITFDWTQISGYIGSPLVPPW